VRKQANLKHSFPLFNMHTPDDLILTPYLPEIDYPYSHLPPNLIGCGPIVLPPVELRETDADLALWLERNPVVLVNLGTHFTSDARFAVELARGIQALLEARKEIQVLWKLKYEWSNNPEMVSLIGDLVKFGRLRITSWLVSEPSSILATSHVICSVHHGGANSYYEACR